MALTTPNAKSPDAYSSIRLLSIVEAGDMLGISAPTIQRLMHNKKDPLPSVKIGRHRKFKLDKLLFWIEQHEQGVAR